VVRKCVLGDYILKLNNDLYITATGNTLAREPPMMIPFEKISNRNQVKGMARGIEVGKEENEKIIIIIIIIIIINK